MDVDFPSLSARLAAGARDRPLYRRLADLLLQAVRDGEAGAGSRFPSERDLARGLGISRTSVAAAYRLLREDGLLVGVRGGGTRVVVAHGLGPAVPASLLVTNRFAADHSAVIDLSSAVVLGEVPLRSVRGVDPDRSRLLGSRYDPLGLPPLRRAIADRYTACGLPTDPGEILVTSGAQQAIGLVFSLFARGGGSLLLEDPTYPGALDTARATGIAHGSVPVDADGIRVEALREAIARMSPSLLFVMTRVQNPTGAVLEPIRRSALLREAAAAGVTVMDDGVLADLVADGSPCDPGPETADLMVGSLSKVCWQGLRIGWVRAGAVLMQKLARLKAVADLGTSVPSQLLAVDLLEGLEEIVAVRRRQVAERLDLATERLLGDLPEWDWSRPAGGHQLWVRLPRGDAESFAASASRHGVWFLPGNRASPDGAHTDRIRISVGCEPATLRSGLDRLVRAWRAYDGSALTGSGSAAEPG